MKKYCSVVFLDISQAFNKVCHPGLIYKITKILPTSYYKLLKLYLSDWQFQTKVNEVKSVNLQIASGILKCSVTGPLLHVLHRYDLPTTGNTIIRTYADDTVIRATH